MLSGEILHIAEAEGGISAHVEHVEINGMPFVLKTDTEFDVKGEVFFQEQLKELGLPHIIMYEHPNLRPNQILMEQIDGSSLNGPNFTNKNLTKLGQTLAIIHTRKFDQLYDLDPHGQFQPGEWIEFVANMKNRAAKTAKHISGATDAVERATRILTEQAIDAFVMCHGDLHGNNVFCTSEGLVLFDNNASDIVATPQYDLAVIFGEVLPGYRYGAENAQGTRDVERMKAFLEGYGDLPADFEETIDEYVLLRLLARYPNQFVPHQDATIDLLIANQTRR